MEDIVGIHVRDREKGLVGFMTWGRLFHRTDPTELERIVSKDLPTFGLNQVTSVKLCDSLQEVAHFTFFLKT
jgi:hypothetical protein